MLTLSSAFNIATEREGRKQQLHHPTTLHHPDTTDALREEARRRDANQRRSQTRGRGPDRDKKTPEEMDAKVQEGGEEERR